MGESSRAAVLVQQVGDAENARDWAELGRLFADDVTIEHPGIGAVTGREANMAVLRLILGAIDGYHRTVESVVVDGTSGAFRFTITGTHTGDLPGFPATGAPVEIAGAMFFESDGTRLTRAIELVVHDSIRGLSLR